MQPPARPRGHREQQKQLRRRGLPRGRRQILTARRPAVRRPGRLPVGKRPFQRPRKPRRASARPRRRV
ncbi:MAG: hypothetical protein EXS42_08010 [Lacunisphaera sp.]|nr:hypothetical protein [Lacunisphaera sp.]